MSMEARARSAVLKNAGKCISEKWPWSGRKRVIAVEHQADRRGALRIGSGQTIGIYKRLF